MKFKGRIYKVLPERSGVRDNGKEWHIQPFIFEYRENETDRFPDRVVLETFNTDWIACLKEGNQVEIGFSHSTHEYNGRYFNDIGLYSFALLDGKKADKPQQQAAADPAPAAQTAESKKEGDDDLPF